MAGKFDAERVRDLLEIADLARDYPSLKVVFDEAVRELSEIAHELQEAIDAEKEKAA